MRLLVVGDEVRSVLVRTLRRAGHQATGPIVMADGGLLLTAVEKPELAVAINLGRENEGIAAGTLWHACAAPQRPC